MSQPVGANLFDNNKEKSNKQEFEQNQRQLVLERLQNNNKKIDENDE